MFTIFDKEATITETRFLGYELAERVLGICVILFIAFLSLMIVRLSFIRFFDFDEFQVLYASAALLRGKALYSDNIGVHFPFANILLSLFFKVFGFKTFTVVLIRYSILLLLLATLFFVFKITEMIWGKNAGLLAVSLTMACLVFIDKGIEIRHDTFNMTFNTIGAYWALRYLKERKVGFICISGLFLGLALASTQKAAVWNIGIIIGLSLCTFKEMGFVGTGRVLVIYSVSIMIPLLASYSYLFMASTEKMKAVLDFFLADAIGYLGLEKGNTVYPFPYTKASIFKGLVYENGLFYLLSVIAIFSSFFVRNRWGNERVLILLWSGAGILFYVIAQRPFHQSFLPTIPALGILVTGFLTIVIRKVGIPFWPRRVILEGLLIMLLLLWPSYLVAKKALSAPTMKAQVENISFCVENSEPHDKVLCFTQQQIYLDPVLRMVGDECGDSIYVINADCFEREMIQKRCRIVINDHRTRFLNKAVKKKIRDHYIYTGIGDILVPGFSIGPRDLAEREVWVSGTYYSPTLSLMVAGEKIRENLVDLDQKRYRFENLTSHPVMLMYIFNKEDFVRSLTKGVAN